MPIADLDWALGDLKDRAARYALARAYDEGHHRLLFATEKFRNTFGDLFREFADNMCEDVLDAITDRLQPIGWSSSALPAPAPGEEPPDDALGQAAQSLWDLNRGSSRAGLVHRNGFREGDGFTIVDTDTNGRVRIHRQRPEHMAVRYSVDNPDDQDVAAKVWRSGKRWRANLYYPDGTVERYATKGLGIAGGAPGVKSWGLVTAGDPALAEGQEAVTDGEGVEGTGVFHYPNGTISEYGRSLLAGVIPLQDALNKSIADMLVAMEFHAYPQRWATGVQTEVAPDGTQRNPFAAGEGRVWRVGAPGAKFGQFDPAAMDGFLDVQDSFRIQVARKGVMPGHTITLRNGGMNAPTGIALLVAEGRTIKLAKDRQRDWGHEHRREMAYALNLAGHAGVTSEDLALNWAPPETRDMKALLEELAMKSDLGVPRQRLLEEAGYTPDEVREFLDDAEAEGEAAELARATLTGGRRTVTTGQAGALVGLQPPPDRL